MNIEKIKEIIKTANDVATHEDESKRFEIFKIVLEKLLEENIVNSIRQPPAEQQKGQPPAEQQKGQPPADELQQNIQEFAQKCSITIDELKNVIVVNDHNVELVPMIGGNDSQKMTIVSLCVIGSTQMIFRDNEWVKSKSIADVWRSQGLDTPHLSRFLKTKPDLFLKHPSLNEYKLQIPKGRDKAYEIITKLAKGEKLHEN